MDGFDLKAVAEEWLSPRPHGEPSKLEAAAMKLGWTHSRYEATVAAAAVFERLAAMPDSQRQEIVAVGPYLKRAIHNKIIDLFIKPKNRRARTFTNSATPDATEDPNPPSPAMPTHSGLDQFKQVVADAEDEMLTQLRENLLAGMAEKTRRVLEMRALTPIDNKPSFRAIAVELDLSETMARKHHDKGMKQIYDYCIEHMTDVEEASGYVVRLVKEGPENAGNRKRSYGKTTR